MSVFGYVNDNDESLKSKSGGKFGLNQGFITKLEYNPNAGKDGAAADAVDMTIQIGEKEFRNRIYDVTGALYKGGDLVEKDEEGYQELYMAEMNQRMAVVIHTVKATGVTDEQLKTALANPPADFKGWAEIVCALVPTDFKTKSVDVFLEYQWNIKGDNDRTYLQLPQNMKGGRFLCASVAPVGSWEAKIDSNGLRYVDSANNEHPFDRSANYMDGNKAKQQIEGEEESAGAGIASTSDKKNW